MASNLLQAASTSNPLNARVTNGLTTLTDTLTGKRMAFAKLSDVAGDFVTNIAIALLILLVTLWLSKWAQQLARAAFGKLPHRDATLREFIASLVRYAVMLIGGIAILNRLGFQTASIITVLGAASLAVGLALQGALSNVAAGVMILLFRPYRVGDIVNMAGKLGTVKRLDLFNTELVDFDGLKVVVPNHKGFGDVITNYTDIPRRRIQHKFGIDYDDSIDEAMAVVLRVVNADPRVLQDPKPWCMVTELGDSQVTVELRAWTEIKDYWVTRYDLLRKVKEAFDAAGVTIPYPTQTQVSKDVLAAAPRDAETDETYTRPQRPS